jgi:hypothetical protein
MTIKEKQQMTSALLVLATALSLAAVRADELQTLITTSGHRFEKARVTEVTPATITIVHSTGVARMPLSEFPADVQKKFGYDEARAKAWLVEQAKAEQARRDKEAKEKTGDGARVREQVDAIAHYLDAGGHLQIDHRTGQLYDPDLEAARRAAAFRDLQRYGQPHPSPR